MYAGRTLYDPQGNGWALEQEVNVGGEGAVYTVASKPGLLAKVYLKPPSSETADKLRHMVRAGAPSLHEQAAWPITTLHQGPRGPLVGFLMPRFADHRPIHNLYLLTPRKRLFPDADWDFLIRAAESIAAAFAAIHARGTVVGDVNQGNVMVSARASVALIDCDSFQVTVAGRCFPCLVGVPEFTPPELQQIPSFRNLVRTVNHDRFGLAVLLFYLLLMGKHPFAGRPLDDREMDLDEDIRHFRFAYGRGEAALRVAPPPFSPTLDVLSPELRELFEPRVHPGLGSRRPAAKRRAVARSPRPFSWPAAPVRQRIPPDIKSPAICKSVRGAESSKREGLTSLPALPRSVQYSPLIGNVSPASVSAARKLPGAPCRIPGRHGPASFPPERRSPKRSREVERSRSSLVGLR